MASRKGSWLLFFGAGGGHSLGDPCCSTPPPRPHLGAKKSLRVLYGAPSQVQVQRVRGTSPKGLWRLQDSLLGSNDSSLKQKSYFQHYSGNGEGLEVSGGSQVWQAKASGSRHLPGDHGEPVPSWVRILGWDGLIVSDSVEGSI